MATKKQIKAPLKKPSAKQAKISAEAQKRLATVKAKATVTKLSKYKSKAIPKTKSTSTSIVLSPRYQQTYDKLEIKDSEFSKFEKLIAGELKRIRRGVKNLEQQYRDKIYEGLGEAYKVYQVVISSPYADDLLNNVRWALIDEGHKIQKNTNNAAMIIKYCWADAELTNKKVYDYSTALQAGQLNNIETDYFVEWVKKISITQVIADYKQKDEDSLDERMRRARLVILRWLETKERNSLAQIKMTAWEAERLISAGTNQVVMLGTALRRMDRESFYADIHITTILPPNIDIDVMVVDRMAKQIVDVVGRYEEQLKVMDEELWSKDLEAYLSAEEAEATRQTVEKWKSKRAKND